MTLALTLWSIFTTAGGAAINYVMLLAIRVVFGATEGIFPGASMKAIVDRTRPKTRMTANGIMLASNPFGAALVNFGGQAGGLVVPMVMGFLADRFSFVAAFSFLVFGAVLAAAASLWSPQNAREFRAALGEKLPAARGVAQDVA